MNTSQEIRLYFEFDKMSVRLCNFNMEGELIFFCKVELKFRQNDFINLVCVYSIETRNNLKETKCQKIYMISKDAELISITKHNKIWLRQNNHLYEWDLRTACTTMALKNVYEVNMNFKIIYCQFQIN